MKHQGNGDAPMWVSRQPSRSLSFASHDTYNNESRRNSGSTMNGHLHLHGRERDKYPQYGYLNRSDTSPSSWSHSDSTPFVPTIYPINEEHASNVSTLTYTSSPSIAAVRRSQGTYSCTSSREPIRATLTAYESSVASSASVGSMMHSSYRSCTSLTSNKQTWSERINRALKKLLPPSSSYSGTSADGRTSRRSNSIVTVLTNNATDPHLIRFSRGHAANLREPILTASTSTTSMTSSIVRKDKLTKTTSRQSSTSPSSSHGASCNVNHIKLLLSNSKSVFIVSAICIISGSLIFPLSLMDLPDHTSTIQLIASMFLAMGVCIFILAILFTLSAYHLTTKARHNADNTPRLDSA